jgi:uncharacterized membrane protein YhhN
VPSPWLLAFLVLAVADWIAVALQQRPTEWILKPLALLALIGWAATSPSPNWWLVAALAFSLAGDVFLMLPFGLFVAGVAAFLLAHLAYLGTLDGPIAARLGWWAAVLVVTGPFAMRIYRSVTRPPLRAGLAVYMLALTAMTGSAIATGVPAASVGATLFLASDTLIAWDRFVSPQPWARPVIMATYHLGQLGLAVALRTGAT